MVLANKATLIKLVWRRIPLTGLVLSIFFLTACGSDRQSTATNEADSATKTLRQSDSEEKSASNVSEQKRSESKPSEPENSLKTDRPYINRLLPEAQRIQQEFDIPVETTLAIAIHETGWGKYEIGQNNHFGLRCASDDCITLNKNGADIRYETCPDETECFDMFARSLVELSNDQPSDLRVIYNNGYATSPSWVRKVRRIRRQVKKTLNKAGVETSG